LLRPCASLRATCGARFRRGLAKLASLKQTRSLIRLNLRSSAHPEGVGKEYQTTEYQYRIPEETRTRHGESLLSFDWSFVFVPRSRLPRPGWAEERRGKRIRAGTCLSEASLCQTPLDSSTAGCPQRSVGTQTAGRLFFGDFLLAKQKKVTGRRATPGQQASAKSAKTEHSPDQSNL
jgi:hypothetical protein